MKNLYTKIFVLKKYVEKTKEVPWNIPNIQRIKTS